MTTALVGVLLIAPEATSLAGHLEKVDDMLPTLPESTHKKKRAVDNNFQVGIHRSHRLNMAPPRNKAHHRRKAERREREPRVQLRQKLPGAETRDILYDAELPLRSDALTLPGGMTMPGCIRNASPDGSPLVPMPQIIILLSREDALTIVVHQ